MEFRKMVTITLCTRQQKRHWCIEESYGLCGRGRRQWHPTPVLLPGESQGRRSLVGCSPCDFTFTFHFYALEILHCVYVPPLSYPFICWWTSRLLPYPGYYKRCCDEHWGTRVSFPSGFLSVYAQQWDCWIIRQFYFQFFKESPHCSPEWLY